MYAADLPPTLTDNFSRQNPVQKPRSQPYFPHPPARPGYLLGWPVLPTITREPYCGSSLFDLMYLINACDTHLPSLWITRGVSLLLLSSPNAARTPPVFNELRQLGSVPHQGMNFPNSGMTGGGKSAIEAGGVTSSNDSTTPILSSRKQEPGGSCW